MKDKLDSRIEDVINTILSGKDIKEIVEDFGSGDAVPADSGPGVMTGHPSMGVSRKRRKKRKKLLRRRKKMKSKKESAADDREHAEELAELIPSLTTKNKGEPKERKGYIWKKLPVQPQEGDDNMKEKKEATNPDGVGDGKPKTQGEKSAPNVSSIPGSGGSSSKGAKATHKNVDGIGSSKTGAEEPAKGFTGPIGDGNNVPGCKISMPGGIVKTEPLAKTNTSKEGSGAKPAVESPAKSFVGSIVKVKTIQQGAAHVAKEDSGNISSNIPTNYKCGTCNRHMRVDKLSGDKFCPWCANPKIGISCK